MKSVTGARGAGRYNQVMDFETFEAPAADRLDASVAGKLGISRVAAKDLVQAGYAQVNGLPVSKPAFRLSGGEIVSVLMPDLRPEPVQAEDITVDVFFEDADLLVVNKPPGLTVHPTPTLRGGTLVNALMGRYTLSREHMFDPAEGDYRPGIVHRLDKDTSGVMVVARNDKAHVSLMQAFKKRLVQKEYVAIAAGRLGDDEIQLEAPIGRHPVKRQQMTVAGLNAKSARTIIHVLERIEGHVLVRVKPHTGRTHQIRVHLAHLHAPILGDHVYGRDSPLIGRQALHAHSLTIPHPHDGQAVTFTARVPDDMREAWHALGGGWPAELDGPV